MAIYFIRVHNFVKIGYSADPVARIQSLQCGNPYLIEMLAVIPGDHEVETALHHRFSHLRREGEWFDDCDEIQEAIGYILAVFPDFVPKPSPPAETIIRQRDAFDYECGNCGQLFGTQQAVNAHQRWCDGSKAPVSANGSGK